MNLPVKLTKEEIQKKFIEYKNGSIKARNAIIMHNLRLVYSRVTSKYKNFEKDRKDIISSGICGLIKAVETFDINSGYDFSTYAVKCIDNQINQYLYTMNKYNDIKSLDEKIYSDDSDDLTFIDILVDENCNIEKTCEEQIIKEEKRELFKLIREIIDTLPMNEKNTLKLYFGLYDGRCYTQVEITKILNMKRGMVGWHIKKGIEFVRVELKNRNILSNYCIGDGLEFKVMKKIKK